MTALDRYVRLEALGLWRERPDASPREVVVSFGSTTLVLSDLRERPLGHWALAGVAVLGRDRDATIYAMTADGEETLAIRDPEMVAAIAAVSRARLEAPAAPPSRRRLPVGALVLLAVLAALAVAAPRAIRAAAAALMPSEQAAEIGDRMLIALIEGHGAPCAAAPGERALARLAERLDPDDPPRLRVIGLGRAPVAALPGGTLLIDRDTLAAAASPEEIAGWAALGMGRDPVAALLRDAGPLAGLRYVFSADIGEPALSNAAEAALIAPDPAELAPALLRLEAAALDPQPFLAAFDRTATAPGAADGAAAPPARPALADPDWIAMRKICG